MNTRTVREQEAELIAELAAADAAIRDRNVTDALRSWHRARAAQERLRHLRLLRYRPSIEVAGDPAAAMTAALAKVELRIADHQPVVKEDTSITVIARFHASDGSEIAIPDLPLRATIAGDIQRIVTVDGKATMAIPIHRGGAAAGITIDIEVDLDALLREPCQIPGLKAPRAWTRLTVPRATSFECAAATDGAEIEMGADLLRRHETS